MLSFTVCWVIPREWRGWKTSRFRPLAEEITHIYIFLSSLQAQSSNVGDRQLVSWSPSLCRLLPHASARLRTQGNERPQPAPALAARSGAHGIPGAVCGHKSPSGASTGLLRPLRRPLLLRSPVPVPLAKPWGQRAPLEQQEMAPLSLSRHTIM